jgi:glutaminyl-tRNA synthetase
VKDAAGEVVELHCTHDPASRGGATPDGRRVKGTLHWVSARHSRPAEIRLYDHLFAHPHPGERTGNYLDDLNPDSLEILTEAQVEPSLASAPVGSVYQFLRQGYFAIDPDTRDGALVFNRTVGLKDSGEDAGRG